MFRPEEIPADPPKEEPAGDGRTPLASWYMIGVLLLIYVTSTMDRSILAIMMVDMKADLGFSDTQMALLSGTAFAIFYTTVGLPMGWVADHKPRRSFIFWAASLWAACSSMIGFAQNFLHIFLSRMGVGAAEAALGPAAYSLIGDRFPRRKLAAALGVYSVGGILGSSLSLILGGLLLHWFATSRTMLPAPLSGWEPWRLTLLAAGLPGIAVAALVFTFREPPRRARRGEKADWRAFGRFLGQEKRLFFRLLLAWGLVGMIAMGTSAWTPTFLRRVYGMSALEAGATTGGLIAVAGVMAHALNGFFVDWLSGRGHRDAPLRFFIWCAVVATPIVVAGFLVQSLPVFILGFLVKNALLTPVSGYASASVQMITPAVMRGRAGALFLMAFNILGIGLGPLAIGWVTDTIWGDPQSVGLSLALMTAVCATGAVLLLASVRAQYRRRVEIEDLRELGQVREAGR